MKSTILATCLISFLAASSVSASVTPEQCLANYGEKVAKIERLWHKIHRVETVGVMAAGVGAIAGSFISIPLLVVGMATDVGVAGVLSLLYKRQVNKYFGIYGAVLVNSDFAPFVATGLSRVDEYKGEPTGYSMDHLNELRGTDPSMFAFAYEAAQNAYQQQNSRGRRQAVLPDDTDLGDLFERLSAEKPLRNLKTGQFTKIDLSLLLKEAADTGALCSPDGEPVPYQGVKNWIVEQVRGRL